MIDQNVPGLFDVTLGGVKREVKVTFGLVDRLERRVLNRPLTSLLTEAAAQVFRVSDMVTVIHEALVENKDKRMSYEEVGEAILRSPGGASSVAGVYVDILVYALTGGVPDDGSGNPVDDKKK